MNYQRELGQAGVHVNSGLLQSFEDATQVQVNDAGERLVTNGAACWPCSRPGSETSISLRRLRLKPCSRRWRPGRALGSHASRWRWLATTARRQALDRIRRDATLAAKLATLHADADPARRIQPVPQHEHIPDDRLQLMLACCHPALDLDTQTGLTCAMSRA